MNRPDHRGEIARALGAKGAASLCAELEIVRSKTERGKYVCPRHGGGALSVRDARDGMIQVRCFGCDLAGDAFTLIAEVRGLAASDFRAVLSEAAELAGLWDVVDDLRRAGERRTSDGSAARERRPPTRPAPPPRAPEPEPLSTDDFDAIVSMMLERSPLGDDARSYLDARKMRDLATRAGWGELPGTEEGQAKLVGELVEAFGIDRVQRAGLLVRRGPPRLVWQGHRLLIPWFTPGAEGLIHTLQRRLLREPMGPKEPKYVFPTGATKPVWPYVLREDLEELGEETPIAFVEGAPDVLALRWLARAADRELVAMGIPGVENWRQEWARFVAGRPVLIALDADRAGESKVEAMQKDMHNATAWTRMRPPAGMGKDWGEYLVKVRSA